MIEVEQPRGRDRPVRRADAAEARRRPGRGRRAAARHERRGDRPGRGSRRASARCSSGSAMQAPPVCDRALGRMRPSARPSRSAFRCSCGPPTCSGAGRWRSSTRATASPTTCSREAAPERRRDLPRPLPRERDRGRRRCAVRRATEVWIGGIMQHVEEAGVHSGDSACVLPPHSLGEEMLEQIRAATREHRARDRRRRAAERAVRRPRRRAVRDRGQPARLAHGAVRLQGDRRAAGQARLPDHAR